MSKERKNKLPALVSIAIATVVAVTGTSAVMARTHPTETPVAVAAAAKRTPTGGTEGIKVHGHWRFVVTNSDGTVAQERDFENAVSLKGLGISRLLRRADTPGRWAIILTVHPTGSSVRAPCSDVWCTLLEGPSAPASPGTPYPNLAVTQTAADAGDVVLDGTFAARSPGEIGRVMSGIFVCNPAVPPSDCYSQQVAATSLGRHPFPFSRLTETTLDTPFAVAQGQQVHVTVKISYS